MADQLGPLSLKITASPQGLEQGLAQSEQMVQASAARMDDATAKTGADAGKGWALSLAEKIKGGLGDAGEALQGAGQLVEKALGNPARFLTDNVFGALGNVAGRIPGLGPLLALPFEGLQTVGNAALDLYDQGSQKMLEVGKAARAAGLEIGEFQAFASLVGDTDQAAAAMFRFQTSLQTAAQEGVGADNAFTRLGIDAAKLLTEGSALNAWGVFADRLKEAGGSAAKLDLAGDVFGRRQAGALMDALGKGSAGVERRSDLIDLFGGRFDEGTLTLIKQAKEAQREIALFKQGFETQVTVGLAPVITALAEMLPKLSEMGISAKGLSGVVTDIGFGILDVGAFLVDVFTHPTESLEDFKTTWLGVEATMLEGIARLGSSISSALLGPLGKAGIVLDVGLRGASMQLGGSGSVANDLRQQADELRKQQASREWSRALDLAEAEFEGRGTRTARDALAELKAEILGRRDEVNQAVGQFDPFAAWKASADAFNAKLDTPFDKLRKEAAALKGQLDGMPNAMNPFDPEAGLKGLALEDSLKARGGWNLLQQLRSAPGGAASPFVGAAEAGSREAFSAVNEYRAQREDLQEEIARLTRQAVEIAQQQLQIGRDSAKELENLNNKLRVVSLP